MKKRLSYVGQWVQKQCWWCLHRLRHWKSSDRGRRRQDSIIDDSLEEKRQYWGPLIAAGGGNGPSAKPLFTKFKAEGHVTTACLWHACRAVTFGSLLIVMGITMAVLGKILELRDLIPVLCRYVKIFICFDSAQVLPDAPGA